MTYISKNLENYVSAAPPGAVLQVVVKLDSAAARIASLEAPAVGDPAQKLIASARVAPIRSMPEGALVILRVTAAELESLRHGAGIEYVRPLRIYRPHLDVSVGLLALDSRILPFDGYGIRVAVIDSGIDADHPDLAGRVNLALSRNFTAEGGPNDVTDHKGHGTHVAGIIGGSGAHFRGVAPKVEFISCKVFPASGETHEGVVQDAIRWAVQQNADVINFSGGHVPRFDGILLPPPWVWSQELLHEELEMQSAMDAGVVCVVSAGNDGGLHSRGTLSVPATCPAVISVGSVDKQRQLSRFSSIGPAFRSSAVPLADNPQTLTGALAASTIAFPEVDLVAPGGEVDHLASIAGGCLFQPGIVSALSSAMDSKNLSHTTPCVQDVRYIRLSGTSQAAPHVAGLAALVLSAARAKAVDLGPLRAYVVKNILRAAAIPISGGHSIDEQGRGIPDWTRIEQILDGLAAGSLQRASFETKIVS